MSKSANAILALSRAYFGKCLTASDYTALLECRSLSEFAAALKANDDYAPDFSAVSMAEITSKTLEALIEKHRFDRFVTLCRFELAIGNRFYQYFINRTEIDQILNCTLLMFGNKTEDYMLQMHPFIDKHLSIDLYQLGKANSLEEIAQSLDKTRYGKLYRGCLSAENYSYLTFEQAFEAHFSAEVKTLIESCFSGSEKKALRELVCRSHDCKLIEKIIRTLKYYNGVISLDSFVSPALISMTLFTDGQIRRFAACETVEAFLALLAHTPYGDWVDAGSSEPPELQMQKRLFALCRKQIRFSVYPGVVMFCYLLLSQTQRNNLVRIVEGIKFNIPAPLIQRALIFAPDAENGG